MKAIVTQHFLEPFESDEYGLTRTEDVLNGIVDYGHQRYEGTKGHDNKSGQNQKPGLVVLPLFHCALLSY